MIEEQSREAVRTLFEQGKRKKEIARFLGIDIKTVRAILRESTGSPKSRIDKITLDYDLLKQLYHRCDGYAQRVHEILSEEHKIQIGYSTLTRLLHQHGIGRERPERDQRYPDLPGAEMQHDTTVYRVSLGGRERKVVCSGLYFRYCKMRYVKFYFRFTRFLLKCFFHEALAFFGYAAKRCIIDNTNLVVLYGSGERAVFDPEMLAFARQYGFQWKAHRIGQANRKAGKERNFLTVETNFFPGRSFRDIEDLNRQAFQWATQRFAQRPQSKSRLIPCQLFEEEKPYLLKLPDDIPLPYEEHHRNVDDYGYVAFDGNYYWLPEKVQGVVTVLEYERSIAVYRKTTKLIDYSLPPAEVKNQQFSPPDRPVPQHYPHNRRYGCAEEQKRLREMDDVCSAYLDYIESPACNVRYKDKLVRDLYRFSTKVDASLFLTTIERALKYQINSIASVERIAAQLLQQQLPALPAVSVDEHYEERKVYQIGRFSSETDLSEYQRLLEEEHDER